MKAANPTIYSYWLDPITGQMTCESISKYKSNTYGKHTSYSYDSNRTGKKSYRTFRETDLDRVKAWHIYTYEKNEERARKMFMEYLTTIRQAAWEEYNRYDLIIKRVNGENVSNLQ